MFTVLVAFITAIGLASVAAWFSITGLMAIFAGLPIQIAIMAGVLEVGKLVTASIIYRHWSSIPRLIKSYLSVAVVVLMFITSLGIFGYLSKAHVEQNAPVSNNIARVERIQQRIESEQKTITDSETVIKQLDETVSTLIKFDKISGPTGARAVRQSQQDQRNELKSSIETAQANVDKLLDEKAQYDQQIRNFEIEIGPIKYITALLYDDPTAHYEEAVRYIILLLIFVFDPLAVLLLITANHIQMNLGEEESDEDEDDESLDNDELWDFEFEEDEPTDEEQYPDMVFTDVEDEPELVDNEEYESEDPEMPDNNITVSNETFEAIMDWLDKPAEPNEQLKKLMSTPAPWESSRDALTETASLHELDGVSTDELLGIVSKLDQRKQADGLTQLEQQQRAAIMDIVSRRYKQVRRK